MIEFRSVLGFYQRRETAMLSVRMLGVLTVSIDGQLVNDDLGPSGRLLSGYLFEFMGKVHRRERLADQFWDGLEPERARAAFNTALWRLRKLLARDPSSEGGQNLRTLGSEIVLETAPWLSVDTHQFESAIGKTLDWQQRPNEAPNRVNALESAIQKYEGPFLEGEDADWVIEERERLHSLYIRAASELVRCFGCNERYEEAIAVARRVLVADPFREGIFRSLALLLVLDGQRAAALRHYERWRASFRRELGIDPMPQTIRLADDIRSGQIFDYLDNLKSQYFHCPSLNALTQRRGFGAS
jgi:DNA-binding SARP family transcriptional activator